MGYSFRDHHTLQILQEFESQEVALDSLVNRYLRLHKAIGSKDRKVITEAIFGIFRWKGLLDHLGAKTWEERLHHWQNFEGVDETLPLHLQCGMPKDLFDHLSAQHGEKVVFEWGKISNTPAPISIRVNTLKITRDELAAKLSDRITVKPSSLSDVGLVLERRAPIMGWPEYKEGLFEMQDEGSQLLASLVDAKPGEQVLDYCAGAGGKALAIAPRMENQGQLYLYDIRRGPLLAAKKRLARAGVENAQWTTQMDKRLKGKMDWVLVDSPCSGTGTFRRNVEMKWKITPEEIDRLVRKQGMIFERALPFLTPQGKIVYGTCSVCLEENWMQLEKFCKKHNLVVVGEPLSIAPTFGGPDAFFGAVLTRA